MKRFLPILLSLTACIPDRETRPSHIDEATVIAMRAEPAEAAPGDEVAFALLVASPDGTLADPDARWSFCQEPRPPGETGAAASACVDDAGDPFGEGASASAPLPDDACAIHGPDTPPGDFRPRDPDATGGYYQPVRIDLDDALTFGGARIGCQLANAPVDIARQFRDEYRFNRNPSLFPLALPDTVTPGDTVELAADWPADDAESYLYYDPVAQALVTRREAMSLSWYATAGAFESDRTGRGEEEDGSASSNRWTATETSGPVHVWVVLRDSRGGTAWADGAIEVRE